jgi:hypothetical protein
MYKELSEVHDENALALKAQDAESDDTSGVQRASKMLRTADSMDVACPSTS